MPPRAVKRGAKARAARGAKAAAAAATAAASTEAEETEKMEEETVRVEEETVTETKEEMKVEEVGIEEEKPSVEESEAKSSANAEDIGDVKEPHEEEDRGERLELEDEPEYEVEEETAVDYGEREVEHGEQELVEEAAEEDGEGDIGDEEEAEVADQEMDDGREDAEGEEYVEGEEEENEVDGEGQEHHEVVKEHRKRKEFEIFVGGLDKDATEDDLRKVFSAVGEITEVRLMMNPLTKKNKGFAFLRFATVEQAIRAVSELKTPVVNGKQCGVAPCRDSDTLFVGNICKTWTKEHLKEKLKNFGIENLEDLSLVEDTNSEGMNRGFAFLEFTSRSEAMEAFRRLQRRDVFLGTERNAKVSFADSFIEPDDEIMAQVKTIFIDGLPATWDEDRVKDYLKKYGLVESIELARNMPSAKRKDFGFVTFDTHDNAVTCAEAINNKELGEGDHKVKVRARLSRPHQKGTGNRDNWGESRIGRGFSRGGHISYSRPPPPHRFPGRGIRPIFSTRGALTGGRGFKRPIPFRGKRPFMAVDERPRRLPPPERSYDRRPPVPVYPKSSTRREHGRRDEPPPRGRAVTEYPPRIPIERRSAYRDEYSDIAPRSDPRGPDRRAYVEDGYGRKPERPPPTYREGPSRNYDSFSGSKRPYSELDDVPPRYVDVSMRHSRARLEYGVGGNSAQYDDAYGDRFGPTHMGYGSGRSSLSAQDGLYSSRQGMSYGRGSASGRDVGGMYSSSYSSSYPPHEYDVGGSSYSSLYSGRSSSGNGYLGGRGSGSYY